MGYFLFFSERADIYAPPLRCPRVSAGSLSLPMQIALSLCLPFRSAAWSYIPPAPPYPPIPHKGPVRLDLIMLRPPGKKKRPTDSRRPVSFMLLNATLLLLPQEPARTMKTFARQCPPAEPLGGLDLDVEPGLAIPVLMSNPLPLSTPCPQGTPWVYIYIYIPTSLVAVLVSVLVAHPEAELLPEHLPLLEPLGLDAAAQARLLDAPGPLVGALVLEARPADAVLSQAAQAGEAEVFPALEGLPEIVAHPCRILHTARGILLEKTK